MNVFGQSVLPNEKDPGGFIEEKSNEKFKKAFDFPYFSYEGELNENETEDIEAGSNDNDNGENDNTETVENEVTFQEIGDFTIIEDRGFQCNVRGRLRTLYIDDFTLNTYSFTVFIKSMNAVIDKLSDSLKKELVKYVNLAVRMENKLNYITKNKIDIGCSIEGSTWKVGDIKVGESVISDLLKSDTLELILKRNISFGSLNESQKEYLVSFMKSKTIDGSIDDKNNSISFDLIEGNEYFYTKFNLNINNRKYSYNDTYGADFNEFLNNSFELNCKNISINSLYEEDKNKIIKSLRIDILKLFLTEISK